MIVTRRMTEVRVTRLACSGCCHRLTMQRFVVSWTAAGELVHHGYARGGKTVFGEGSVSILRAFGSVIL